MKYPKWKHEDFAAAAPLFCLRRNVCNDPLVSCEMSCVIHWCHVLMLLIWLGKPPHSLFGGKRLVRPWDILNHSNLSTVVQWLQKIVCCLEANNRGQWFNLSMLHLPKRMLEIDCGLRRSLWFVKVSGSQSFTKPFFVPLPCLALLTADCIIFYPLGHESCGSLTPTPNISPKWSLEIDSLLGGTKVPKLTKTCTGSVTRPCTTRQLYNLR